MSVLRHYELWSLAKLNLEMTSSGSTGTWYLSRNANSLKGIFEMNFTHKIDTFSLPVAWPWPWRLVPGRVLDLVGHTVTAQTSFPPN